jgi:hypothetical protein
MTERANCTIPFLCLSFPSIIFFDHNTNANTHSLSVVSHFWYHFKLIFHLVTLLLNIVMAVLFRNFSIALPTNGFLLNKLESTQFFTFLFIFEKLTPSF